MNTFGNEPNFPMHMHHATLPPIQVTSKETRTAAMAKGFTDHYQRQEWPKAVYHADQEPRTVANPDELEQALADGWTQEVEHVLSDPSNPNSLKLARSPKKPEAPRGNRRGRQADEE